MVFPRYREIFGVEGEGNPFSLARKKGVPSPSSSPTLPQNALFWSIACAGTRRPFPVLTVPRQDYRRENPSGILFPLVRGKGGDGGCLTLKQPEGHMFRNTRAGKGWGAGGSPRIFLFHSIIRMTVAGTPPTMDEGGTSRLTTAPAAMTASSPTVTPGSRIAPAPIQTLRPMVTGARL